MQTTYHNDPKFKAAFVRETRWHRQVDAYVQGTYHDTHATVFQACSVGCSVNSLKRLGKNSIGYDDHAGLANLLGWPEWLCRLQDTIFEGLPQAESVKWTEQLAAAVPVGKEIEPVKWKFCAFLMRENIERVLSLAIDEKLKEQVASAIRQVLAVHESAIKSGEWNEPAARSAESAARSAESAAWSAAEPAAEPAARSAAWSAAWSAARSAARSAAWSPAWSAWSPAWSAWSAAASAQYTAYANELLNLLKSHK